MDKNAQAISDPTDWIVTSLPTFSPLETALRCQVCKDFFNTPMITSCSHTFCSLCIRRCLSIDGKCPACRASDQASKLRRNWAVEDVVATFQNARPQALNIANEHQQWKEQAQDSGSRPQKRRRVEPSSIDAPNGSQRQTRSRTKTQDQPAAVVVLDTDESDGDYIATQEEEQNLSANDGLVGCPMCGDRMKEEAVFSHLDRCDGTPSSRKTSQTPANITLHNSLPPRSQTTTPQERLPELNYSILSDSALRKKLREIGIPNAGAKQLLMRRHTEWVNLWNSNCDSARPRSKRDLLHELDVWERSQGGMARESHGSLHGIMKKEFDAKAYAESNRSDFDRLVAMARAKAKASKVVSPTDGGADAVDVMAIDGAGDGSAGTTAPPSAVDAPEPLNGVHHVECEKHDEHGGHEIPEDVKRPPEAASQQRPADEPPADSSKHEAPQSALPGHFASTETRRVPMFHVPKEPVSDTEHETSQR